MPHFKWEEIKDTTITPSHSVASGKTIQGNMMFLQKLDYKGDRGDGKNGAKLHHHPEEQFIIVLEGVLKIFEDGEWYTIKPGEVFWIPAYSEHEAVWEEEGTTYNFKVRVPGHSWYDHSWQPGSKEEWEKLYSMYSGMTGKFKENLPPESDK